MSFLPSNHFLAGIGLILSVYAVYVEYKVEHLSPDEEFTALCDIQALNASCRYVVVHITEPLYSVLVCIFYFRTV
jgi:hypothetical protein